MELPFASLHQLCGPMLSGLGRLPPPQREALGTAFGLSSGTQPDRFLISLAVLTLLSDTAEKQPLLCLIDDAQWLDRSSAQVLAFVARRLQAESVVLLFAEREPGQLDELARLPDLPLRGLPAGNARELLRRPSAGHLITKCGIGNSPRRMATRWHCLSCRMNCPQRNWPAGSACRAAYRCQAGSKKAFCGARSSFPRPPSGYCWWPRPRRPASRLCCGKRPGRWVSRSRQRAPRRQMACSISARKSPSATRCCGRRSTAPRRRTNAEARIWRWPRPPMRRPIPTAGPGTAPTRRSRLTRTSPTSWSARRGGPKLAAG